MPLAVFPKCFLNALVVDRSMTPHRWIELASQLDVDGLEFYWGFTPHERPEALIELREWATSCGLAIPMMCYSPDFTMPDRVGRKEQVERQKHAIEVTAQLGGQYCRVLSGQRRPEVSIPDGIRWASECIQELLPVAERHRVTLVLENHYKDGYWQYPELAQKTSVFLEFLGRIPPSPWFGVNYDPSNTLIAGEDPIALLEAVKDRVITMHASDRYFEGGTLEGLNQLDLHPQSGYAPFLRHGIVGQGLNNYDLIFSILRSVNFTGWISIEDGEAEDGGMDRLRLSADFLRSKMKEHGLP